MPDERDAGWTSEDLVGRVGELKAIELRALLEPQGLAIVPLEELAALRRAAASYRRLAALVEDPTEP